METWVVIKMEYDVIEEVYHGFTSEKEADEFVNSLQDSYHYTRSYCFYVVCSSTHYSQKKD